MVGGWVWVCVCEGGDVAVAAPGCSAPLTAAHARLHCAQEA